MSTFKLDFTAGPLWNNDEAQDVGPKIAAAHLGKFSGQWTTVIEGQMSVVGVDCNVNNTGSNSYKTDVLAGPLWSDDDAKKYGPYIAASYGGTFTGQWKTIKEGVMSVIEVEWKY